MYNLECVGIRLTSPESNIIIVSAYNSPNLPLASSDLDILFDLGTKVLIMGDLNAKHEYWRCDQNNSRGTVLFDHMVLHDYQMYGPSSPKLVHYNHAHTPSTPDLLLSQNVTSVSELRTLSALSSNHLPVFFSVGGDFTRHSFKQYRYSEANWVEYRSYLDKNISLTSTTYNSINSIDKAVDQLQFAILMSHEINVPSGPSSVKRYTLPRRVKVLISTKNKLRKMAAKEMNPITKMQINKDINIIKTKIKFQIHIYNDKIWNDKLAQIDNPSTDIWRIVKSLTYKPSVIPPLKYESGQLTASPAEQCKLLADTFHNNMSLTMNWPSDNITEAAVNKSSNKLDNVKDFTPPNLVRPREVIKSIRKLKSRKSPGVDIIHNCLLKKIFHVNA